MYHVVYDPSGEMFEVVAAKLHDLILIRGWTFWHPSENKVVFKEDAATPIEGTEDKHADE